MQTDVLMRTLIHAVFPISFTDRKATRVLLLLTIQDFSNDSSKAENLYFYNRQKKKDFQILEKIVSSKRNEYIPTKIIL